MATKKHKYKTYLSRHFREDCHAALRVIAEETETTIEQAVNKALVIGIYNMTGIDLDRDRIEV